VSGEWQKLDEHRGTDVLCDGGLHEFSIGAGGFVIEAVHLCAIGRNRLGSSQMHLAALVLPGDIFAAPGLVGGGPGFVAAEGSNGLAVGWAGGESPALDPAGAKADVDC
jgi:hypothetical protein